ncbi:MAG TPA: extracellular solute-binding protein [Allosphingosinicella sp.]|jgi:accessory colonization factor AcfC
MLSSLVIAMVLGATSPGSAPETLQVYGPGGPYPAMREAAATFERTTGTQVKVTAGPTTEWISQAKVDADLLYSGAETMMTDFVGAMDGQLRSEDAVPLYLRPSTILVRPGNPARIRGLKDLLAPGRRILVVNGSGQQGLWEDVAGRLGDLDTVKRFRANIQTFAKNSAEAKQAWVADPTLDAWLIWDIWQVANPDLADAVPVEPEYRIYRDMGAVLTAQGKQKPAAVAFLDFLSSPEGEKIFMKWGWSRRAGRAAGR